MPQARQPRRGLLHRRPRPPITFESTRSVLWRENQCLPVIPSSGRRRRRIYYDHYMSLYPWVNKYGKYPTGHPTIIYEPRTTDLSPYFGLAKRRSCHRPIYSIQCYRSGLRRIDPLLWRSCVKENMCKHLMERTTVCEHTDDQRTLTGTWCTP